MPKHKPLLAINQPTGLAIGASVTIETTESPAPPALPIIPSPSGVTATAYLSLSALTPKAKISVLWDELDGLASPKFAVRWSTSSDFSADVEFMTTTIVGVTLEGQRVATRYYVQVATLYREVQSPWSETVIVDTPPDDVPPDPVSNPTWAWGSDGCLALGWTNPANDNFKAVEIKIFNDSTKSAQRRRAELAGTTYGYSAAENAADAAGVARASLYIELRAVSSSGYYSSIVSITANKPAPGAIGSAAAAWDAVAGACSFSFVQQNNLLYTLTIDGVARTVQSPYVYDVATNRREHSGMADPALTWNLIATDPLGQTSPASSGTETLARPATPTGTLATWDGRSGVCTWAWSSVDSVAGYQLTIDGVARFVADIRYAYDLATNRREHSGTADPSLTWSLVAMDGLGQTSQTAATGTATLARPATPTGIATDFTSANALWSWGAVSSVVGYRLTIDGLARDLADVRYEYLFATNRQEHGGGDTAAKLLDMANLTWSLVAVDALDQTSTTPASGTLVNQPPAAPTAVTMVPGASGMFVAITNPETRDFSDYTVRFIRDGATLETQTRTVAGFQYLANGTGVYTIGVKVNDVFGQSSTEYVTPSGITLDPLDMTKHRSGITYTDSGNVSGAFADLWDNNRTSGGVDYAMWTSGWRWTQAMRESLFDVLNIRLAATAGSAYIGVQKVDGSWAWYSGPLGSDGKTLTLVASESAAQSAALALPTDGIWALPSQVATRTVKLGHRKTTSGNYTIREFYPRRSIIGDDIDGEIFRGFMFVGDEFVADKLSAITAYLGEVQMSGWATIGSAGGIWQGSAGTPTSPTTGFKLYQSATGKGLWETWLAGVKQVYIGDDMAFYAGAGRVKLDQLGLQIFRTNSTVADWNYDSAIRWYEDTSADKRYPGFSVLSSSARYGTIRTQPTSSGTQASGLTIEATSVPGGNSYYGGVQMQFAGSRSNSSNGAGDLSIYVGKIVSGTSTVNGYRFTPDGMTVGWVDTPREMLDVLKGNILAYDTAMIGRHPAYQPETTTYAAFWKRGSDYSLITEGSSTFLNAPSAGGAVYFRVNNGDVGRFNNLGDLFTKAAIFPSNQSTYYLTADSGNSGLRSNWNLIAANDILLGARSTWLSGWLNQALKTTDSPTFANLYTNDSARIANALAVNASNLDGLFYGLRFGGLASGEGMASNRTGGSSNQYGLDFYTGNTVRMKIANGGNVGIGTDPGSATRLLINGIDTGSNSGLLVRDSNGTNNFSVLNNGNATLRGTLTQNSDRRLKRAIRDLTDPELDKLMQVRAVSYARDLGDRRHRGVIAQELKKIFPELVHRAGGSFGLLSVDYLGFVPLLIAKVQQHEMRLAALEERLANA